VDTEQTEARLQNQPSNDINQEHRPDTPAASPNQQVKVSDLLPRLHFRKQDLSSIFISFSLSLFHFLGSCCYRDSPRERERIPNPPYQDVFAGAVIDFFWKQQRKAFDDMIRQTLM